MPGPRQVACRLPGRGHGHRVAWAYSALGALQAKSDVPADRDAVQERHAPTPPAQDSMFAWYLAPLVPRNGISDLGRRAYARHCKIYPARGVRRRSWTMLAFWVRRVSRLS